MPIFDDETEQPDVDISQDEPLEEKVKDKPARPSLVINVYSWFTPVLAVLMLVIGLLAGYFGRPLLTKEAPAAGGVTQAIPTADPDDDARRQEMMTFLIGQMRHFIGEEDAPVTIIEFSDFQ